MTHDMWHVIGGEHSLKISAPQLLRGEKDSVLKIGRNRMSDWLAELITKVFVEQLRLHRVC